MGGYRKLALIAAAMTLGYVSQASAAVMTESSFFAYNAGYSWSHGYSFTRYFMSWSASTPAFSRNNIQWVAYQTHPGFVPSTGGVGSIDGQDPVTYFNNPIPPWRRGPSVPEPTSAVIGGASLGLLALRRRRA